MNKTKNAAIFLILILSMVLSACSAAQGAGAVKLEGTQWTLVSYGPVGSQTPALPDVKTALSFEKDGRLGRDRGLQWIWGRVPPEWTEADHRRADADRNGL